MLLYIVIALITIAHAVLLYNVYTDGWNSLVEKVVYTILALVVLPCVCLVGAAALLLTGLFGAIHDEPGARLDLQAITAGNTTSGRFFLGSGYVDGDLTYSFYVKNHDGSYYADQIEADEATIVEDGGTYIEEINEVYPSWVFPKTDFAVLGWMRYWDSHYIIHVPQGSIKPIIDMDLPK